MKVKVCGMKYSDNIREVAALQPDYLGFIFYGKSKRNFDNLIPNVDLNIKKTAVFVNASLDFIQNKATHYNFKAIQLHGEESIAFCQSLKETFKNKVEVFKVFSVGETFDFSILKGYEPYCDFFLFDTKGKEKGGNGVTFNWEVLKKYPSEKPFILSGGIGIEEIDKVKELKAYLKREGKEAFLHAVDVNSRFEIEPALKSVEKLKQFIVDLK